jgi:hypothetical protein
MRGHLWSNVLAPAAVYGVVLLFLASAASLEARAQPALAPSPPPPQVQQLLQLLQDPAVRSWIGEQQKPPDAAAASEPEPTASKMMMQRITSLRERLAALAAAVPRLPDEFRNASGRLLEELQGRQPISVLLLVIGFLALGTGAERLFRRVTASSRRRVVIRPVNATSERLHAIVLRFVFNLVPLHSDYDSLAGGSEAAGLG